MNIALIATGGTIGGRKNAEGVIKLTPAATAQIQAIIDAQTVIDDVTIHSERESFDDMYKLYGAVERAMKTCPDGIIITHGTDGLAFSSSYLAYAYSNTRIPIVMCPADLPLNEPASNGFDILQAAKTFIKQGKRGVYVVYKNPGLAPTVHHGARILPAQLHENMFYSIGGSCDFVDSGLMHGLDFDIAGQKVLCILPYVGLDYSAFNVNGYSAVLHSSYRSGAVNSVKFNEFAAAHPDIPMFLTVGRKRYDGQVFGKNIVQCRGITYSALYIKILIGLKNKVKELAAFIGKNACGEIVDKI
ncbi:MAG: asparaginase [Clostridiales bacterium]|nr:asparaginase [Clostridiales bacterium]